MEFLYSINWWGWETALVVFLSSVLAAVALSKKTHWLVGLSFLWFAFSAIRIFSYQHAEFGAAQSKFDLSAISAFAELLLFPLAALAVSSRTWVDIFRIVAMLNVLMIGIGFFFQKPWGILINPSMSGCLAAVLIPFLRGWDRALGILAVFLVARHMPFAVLGGMTFVLLVKYNRRFAWLLLVVPALALYAKTATNGRLDLWLKSYDYWRDNVNAMIGAGSGTFYFVGAYLTKATGQYWVWMHSDWLQIIFEQGFIGFALVVLTLIVALRRASTEVFLSIMGFAIWGVANMPIRYPLAAVFGTVLLRMAFEKKSCSNKIDFKEGENR